MDHNALNYRRVNTHLEYLACERLQQETWGFSDLSVVPGHVLLTFQKRGGIVLGAFDQEHLVGFIFGFVGQLADGTFVHNSVMSAVQTAYRNRGIAYRLKCEQRRLALDQGFSLMTWTFDPLQALNAHFNVNKLGVVVCQYARDLYGRFRDRINQGLPTDRFSVAWWLKCERVRRRLASTVDHGKPPLPHNVPTVGASGWPEPSVAIPNLKGLDVLHLAIPADINALKDADEALALRWRYHVRTWCEAAFEAGFILHAFALEGARGVGVYTLSRVDLERLLREDG